MASLREIKIQPSITQRNQDSIERYLSDISHFPLLTVEEEVLLCRKIKGGDRAALNKLVNCNLRFVVSVAKKYQGQGMALADLIAEGNTGLVVAAERFDDTRGFKFISFAVWWIRQAIMQSINENKRMVRLPMNQVNGIMTVWKAESVLEQQLERPATPEEMAEHTGLDLEKIAAYMNHNHRTVSLDVHPDDDEGVPLLAVLEDPLFEAPDRGLERNDFQNDLLRLMQRLPSRQRRILQMVFGLDGHAPMQMEDVGAVLGVSKETIWQNKNKALQSLRESSNLKLMSQYL